MPNNPKNRRFVVSDIGFGFAIHDTEAPQAYAHPAGREAKHLSSNQLNSVMVEVVATRDEAYRLAAELNAKDEGQKSA